MIRVHAAGEARRGEAFEWDDQGWRLVGDQYGISASRGGFAVTIADWDSPDWWFETLEEAKAYCEEVHVRPNYPQKFQVVEAYFDD